MRFLLIPQNNSLSHIAKCLSIMDLLKLKGHEVLIAVSKGHSGFLNSLGIKHHILSDIQETDGGGFPSFKWFSNAETIIKCIEEETALINQINPDRVLGVFRFTLYASSQIAKKPFDSLICGCMIPESNEVLGFLENEEKRELQKKFLDNFFGFAGKKLSLALKKFNLTEINDIRFALKGEKYAKSLKRKVGLVTNAMLLTPDISLQLLEAGLDSIAFSIDGADINLSSLVRKGTDFNKVISNIKRFVKISNSTRKISKAVFSAVSIDTVSHLKNLVDCVSKLGVDVLMMSDRLF